MKKNVAGVRIDDISEGEAISVVSSWLNTKDKILNPKLIFTPGPEFIVQANRDLEFKNILNSSDLNLPDGFGLHLAGISNRVPGVDCMLKLCQLASSQGWKIGLLGGWEGEGQETASKLKAIYPKLSIDIVIDGPTADNILDSKRSYGTVNILFVGMGHFKQEKLLKKLADKGEEKGVKNTDQPINFAMGMGVGSSFDVICGRAKRPPLWLRKIGLEWLGRLVYNPKHFGRVISATVSFLWLLLRA